MESHNVVIVGGGPTGLGAAKRLSDLGVKDVVVLEREPEAGGIPRHCGHQGFGWQSHRRLWTGQRFARQLRKELHGFDIRTGTTVLTLQKNGVMRIRDGRGTMEIVAGRALIATGTRETPRAARLVGGSRPQGVMTTGAFQQYIYFHQIRPFERPVIIGTELVSFSALFTCRHMGIRPVAMLQENPRTTAPRGSALLARFAFQVPVLTATKVIAIHGQDQVEAVEIEARGKRRHLSCDGAIFTGQFRPENALFTTGPFETADLSPRVDASFRCTDPVYFAAGNVLAPVKSSGKCWQQGIAAAEAIARSLG